MGVSSRADRQAHQERHLGRPRYRKVRGFHFAPDKWANVTSNGSATYPNGTARQFGYGRSGFIGWAIPSAYKVLREIGHTPAWDAGRLETFKRALDSWLSPMNEASASGGLLELGNWNKVRSVEPGNCTRSTLG